MANTIRIKRRASGGSTGAPASLANAELAYNESDAGNGILYYGYGTGGAGGTATQIVAIGGDGAFVSLSGNQTITGNKIFSGSITVSGATIDGFTTTGNVTIGGNLTVNGTTTTINSTTVSVDDKNIELAATASPSDSSADGAGLTIKGDTDKTFNWVNATDAFTSSEHLELANGKAFYINGANVLSATTLGSNVIFSSLTTVATISGGTWQGSAIGLTYGGTGATTASGARTNLGVEIGTNVQAYDADLAALAGVTSAADKLPYFTGSATADVTTLTSFGRSLIDDVDASTARTTLGLGTMAIQNANNVNITGGSIDGVTIDGGTY